MRMRTVIIDDEPAGVAIVNELIEETAGLEAVKSFGKASDAFEYFHTNDPVDIIFCDINMPGINGIEAGHALKKYCKHLIYITAHMDFGAQASEVNATGYLIKPVSKSLFLDKIETIFNEDKLYKSKPVYNHVFFKGENKNSYRQISLDEIVWIAVAENYIQIRTADSPDTYMTKMSLLQAEKKVRANQEFIRISKTHLISIRYIHEVIGWQVILKIKENDKAVILEVGRAYRDDFMHFLRNRGFNL